jgi:hypothetical protein
LDLDETRKQNDRYQENNMSLEYTVKKLQGDIFIFNQEKETLVQTINRKSAELEQVYRET